MDAPPMRDSRVMDDFVRVVPDASLAECRKFLV
jgi:hypothetical protein